MTGNCRRITECCLQVLGLKKRPIVDYDILNLKGIGDYKQDDYDEIENMLRVVCHDRNIPIIVSFNAFFIKRRFLSPKQKAILKEIYDSCIHDREREREIEKERGIQFDKRFKP